MYFQSRRWVYDIPFQTTFLTSRDIQEEFIKRMAQGGYRQAAADRRTNVNYEDMCTSLWSIFLWATNNKDP